MQKLALILVTILVVSGCGLANNLNKMKNNLTEDFTSHPLKVKPADIETVLASGMGIVEMYFGKNVETTWRRIDNQGKIGDTIYKLTYFGNASSGRLNSKLEAGTYFLDGVRFNEGKYHIQSGSSANTLQNKVYGWDSEKQEAICFSFVIKSGEELIIPDVITKYQPTQEGNICPHLEFAEEGVTQSSFKIGPLSK